MTYKSAQIAEFQAQQLLRDMAEKTVLTNDAVISLQAIGLTLESQAGPISILQDVNLEIMAGETVGVVGPSGSGKTSLLMIMAGLERATEGVAHVMGRNFSELSEDALALVRRHYIGIVFQGFHLVPTMTALENVALPLEFANRSDALERAEQALADVGLVDRKLHYPAELSGGEQQRVALARAVANEPAILFADEPTGNLDGATGALVIDQIFDRHLANGNTLVLVTHDHDLVTRGDRRSTIGEGRIIDDSGSVQVAAVVA